MDKVRLGSVMTLHRGYDLPNAQRKPGNVPVISSSGISGSHSIAKLDGENVITGRYGTIGEVFYHSGPCWPLNTTLFVEDFHGNDPKYVAYLLEVTLNALQIDGTDKSTVPGVDRNVLHDLVVPYISDLTSQKTTTRVLSAIDAKIANNKKLMAELEETARLIYDYWFTQFDFPDENGRPYRSSGGKMAWSDELKREIPEGWKASPLSELCGFRNGVNYDKDSMSGSHCRIVNVRNITSSTLFINPSELDEIDLPANLVKRYSLGINDILIARSGTPGAVRLIDEPTDIIFCGFIICCTPNDGEYRSYLTMALKRLEGTTATVTGGSILKNVSQDTLKGVTVVCPPKAVIEQFNAMIDVMLRQIVHIEKESWNLINLRDWLLPMLMNGQATVTG